MKKVQQKRSNRQNNYIWACFSVIAKAWTEGTGRVFTAQEVHDAYCTALIPIDTPKGRVPGSTSSLTQDKMSWFIDSVREDAKEYGVELPSPEDEFFTTLAEEFSNEIY